MSTPADILRDYLINGVLSDHVPALLFDEGAQPFSDPASKIVHVRQEGAAIQAFERNHNVQVWVFSKVNANMSQMKAARDSAELACKTIFESVKINTTIANCDLISDVQGPYKTDNNRYFYRFTFRTVTEF